MRNALVVPVLFIATLSTGTALACSCFPTTPEQHLLSTEVIFSGRVIVVDGAPPDYETCYESVEGCDTGAVAQIAVDQVFKGPSVDYLSVHFGWDGGSCGRPFETGADELVFAYFDQPDVLVTHLCMSGYYSPTNTDYVRPFESMRYERSVLDSLLPSDDPQEAYHRLNRARSSVDYFQETNDPHGRLEAFERWLSIVQQSNGIRQAQREALVRRSLDAVLNAIRIDQYERALPFMRLYQDSGSESPLADLLQSYLDFRLGETSSIQETVDWVPTGHPQTGLLFDRSVHADDLQGTILTQAIFHATSLSSVDLSGSNLEDVVADDIRFHGIDLRDSVLQRVIIDGAEFLGVGLEGAQISDSQIRNATLQLTRFNNAVITNSILQNVNFSQFMRPYLTRPIELRGARFPDTELINVDLSFADLRGVDFSEAKFEDVDLEFARYDCDTHWPSGLVVERLPLIPTESNCGNRVLIANLSNLVVDKVLDFSGLDLASGRFAGTEFSNPQLRAISFTGTSLTGADFSLSAGQVVFGGADLTDADFTNADIGGYMFRATEDRVEPANLTGTRFRGTRIDLARFYDPEHPERSADLTVADLRGATVQCSSADDWPFREIFLELDPGSRGALVSGNCPR